MSLKENSRLPRLWYHIIILGFYTYKNNCIYTIVKAYLLMQRVFHERLIFFLTVEETTMKLAWASSSLFTIQANLGIYIGGLEKKGRSCKWIVHAWRERERLPFLYLRGNPRHNPCRTILISQNISSVDEIQQSTLGALLHHSRLEIG